MAYLMYDTEKMIEVKNAYTKAVSDMKQIQKKMQKMVDNVKEGWESDAGNAFFEKYNDEWLKGFTQYQDVLEHMAYNLNLAEGKYTDLTNTAKNTKLNI